MPPEVTVHLLPTGQTPAMRYNDFTRSAELISLAYAASSDYLAGRPSRPEMPAGEPSAGGVVGEEGGDSQAFDTVDDTDAGDDDGEPPG